MAGEGLPPQPGDGERRVLSGLDTDLIVLSTVRSGRDGIGFVGDCRRLSVAVARAKRGLNVSGYYCVVTTAARTDDGPRACDISVDMACSWAIIYNRGRHTEAATRLHRPQAKGCSIGHRPGGG